MSNSTQPGFEWMDLRRLTEYAAAAVSERTLRAWIHSPVAPLPASRAGRKILVNRRTFDAWLQAHPVKLANSLDLAGLLRREGFIRDNLEAARKTGCERVRRAVY